MIRKRDELHTHSPRFFLSYVVDSSATADARAVRIAAVSGAMLRAFAGNSCA